MPSSSSLLQPDNQVLTCEEALLEELAAITPDDWVDGKPPSRTDLTALCLSGGGIRSAAFCLGGLQALAKKGVLGEFNYLSTVSGGGYIAAWLATIMHGAKDNTALEAAIKALTDSTDPALRSLRNYTNFLIPDGGFGSSETWTAIVLVLRNVLLNWLVFGPILLAAAIVPLLYLAMLCGVAPPVGYILLALGFGCMLAGTVKVCCFVPAHAYDKSIKDQPEGPYGTATRRIQLGVVDPFLAWAFLAPVWFRAVATTTPDVTFFCWKFTPLSIGAFVIPVVGYVIAVAILGRAEFPAFLWNGKYWRNFPYWIVGAAASAFLLHLGATIGQHQNLMTLAVLAPLWVIGAQVLHSTIYVGLRRAAAYGELDREWLARLNGEKLIPILAWTALAAAALVLPGLILDGWHAIYTAVVGFASGPIAAWLGNSAKTVGVKGTTAAKKGGAWWTGFAAEAAVTLATLLFAITLFMLFGRLGAIMVCQLAMKTGVQDWLCTLLIIFLLVILFLLASVSLYCGRRININRFSLHGVYRNRLARAFIGTARPPEKRKPDDYTRFDPGDNLRMQELYQGKQQRGYLFPVINVTLNLTEGAPNSWAERKAAPFTITPLRCGAACLGLPDNDPLGCYVRTDQYGGGEPESGPNDMLQGITLGTAMTISGAAVSPDMGYHSSPATSFLMTLFDVRLGAWLPNPGVPQSWSAPKPDNAIWPLFNEMFGRANDKKANIYLSDGGHFDNLGLYEMLRRKCGLIVVIDAGADPDYCYDDLGRAVRMASIDLDAKVDFVRSMINGKRTLHASGALANITYHDRTTGLLLYLKPWLPAHLGAGVLAYGAAHDDFPHESTADQFFQESQFESYRSLGEQIVGKAFAAASGFPNGGKLRGVLEAAR